MTRDLYKAVYWYTKASEKGFAKAQYSLGSCYYNGEGVNRDINLARYWWQKAAAQGDTDAQNELRKI